MIYCTKCGKPMDVDWVRCPFCTTPVRVKPNPRPPVAKVRPTSITVICILMALGLIYALVQLFTSQSQALGGWYVAMQVFSLVVGVTCLIGFDLMKKWGVVLYTIVTVIDFAATLGILASFPGALSSPYALVIFLPFIFRLIVIGVGFSQYSKMD